MLFVELSCRCYARQGSSSNQVCIWQFKYHTKLLFSSGNLPFFECCLPSANELLRTNLNWIYHSQSAKHVCANVFTAANAQSFSAFGILLSFRVDPSSSWTGDSETINKKDKINEQIKNTDNFCYLVWALNALLSAVHTGMAE